MWANPVGAIEAVHLLVFSLMQGETAKSFPVCREKIPCLAEYFRCSPSHGIRPATH
jgi:hypothetical protein